MPSSPKSPVSARPLVGVGVPVPGLGLLTYSVPAGVARPPKGARVVVPIGARQLVGCVVDEDASPPPDAKIRDVTEVLDSAPYLPAHVVDLALWVGEYYAAGPGDALSIAMPPGARRAQRTTFRTVRVVELVPQSAQEPAMVPLGDKQQQLLTALSTAPGGLGPGDLKQLGVSTDTVRTLAKRGLVRIREEVAERDVRRWTYAREESARELTPEQAAALASLRALAESGTFQTALLHGITGSGKTELYLRIARHVVDRGRRALVLVPEIALTPAAAGLFYARFGDRVAIQHSGLSDGERHDQWHRIRRGDVDVVVGTRSAVFTPLENVGLVVVDEEHDSSYKQDESPRYQGRDVAIVRGQMERALVVLGSATPSLESAANAKAGKYQLLRLTRRVFDRPLARVRIVDMRPEFAEHGADLTLSRTLLDAISDRLARREQVVVLLNRRGFATVIFCRQCGASIECPHCSVTLTYHRAARRLRCHYCNYATAVPSTCGQCGGEYLEQSGFGTERIDAELRARFPGARIARVDRDTVRRRGAIAEILARTAAGDIDVLVGTQMIAKGHDFPAVTLVGVISADVGLGLADFRASERTFQLLTQVVGRAGRGETPGEAIIQTLYPDHYSVRAAATQEYGPFFDREMQFRTAMQYPPSVGLINVVVKAGSAGQAMQGAQDLVTDIRRHGPIGRVVGPAPAALAKIKDEHRAQFFIKGSKRRAMRAALEAALAARPDLRRRTIVDVDPVSVL